MNEYYLHVDLLVRDKDVPNFEAAVVEFLKKGGFGRFAPGHEKIPVLMLRTPNAFTYTGYERFQSDRPYNSENRLSRSGLEKASSDVGEKLEQQLPLDKVVRYVHVWRIPNGQGLDLAHLMQLSADDTDYVALDGLVVREIQNFVTRVKWLSAPSVPAGNAYSLPVPPSGPYLRVIRQFKSADLVPYLSSAGTLLPSLQQQKWHSLGHFQNVTGPLNTITEFWSSPTYDNTPRAVESALSGLHAKAKERFLTPFLKLPLSETREVLVPYPVPDQSSAFSPMAQTQARRPRSSEAQS